MSAYGLDLYRRESTIEAEAEATVRVKFLVYELKSVVNRKLGFDYQKAQVVSHAMALHWPGSEKIAAATPRWERCATIFRQLIWTDGFLSLAFPDANFALKFHIVKACPTNATSGRHEALGPIRHTCR